MRSERIWLVLAVAGALGGALLGCSPNGPDGSRQGAAEFTGGQRPVAVITGGPFSGEAPLDVYLDATSSYTGDPGGWIEAFRWDFGDGTTSEEGWLTHTFPGPGSYPVTLTVTDGTGATATATQYVKVGGAATLAAVIEGGPWAGEAPFRVYLDATSSSSQDPDAWVAAYHWDFGDGASSDEGWLVHTYARPGRYTVTLTVTDSAGATATATHEVLARDAAAQCAAILPAGLGTPLVVRTGSWCTGDTRSTTDGSGNAALHVGQSYYDTADQFFELVNGVPTWRSRAEVGDQAGVWALPQPSGFTQIGVFSSSLSFSSYVVGFYAGDGGYLGDAGRLHRSTSDCRNCATAAVDPAGGTAILNVTGEADAGYPVSLQRFDTAGQQTAPARQVTPTSSGKLAAGVDLSGNILALWAPPGGTRYLGRWFDRGLSPLTDAFDTGLALAPSPPRLVGLLDGSLALLVRDDQGNQRYAGRVPDAQASVEPVPAWLAQRSKGELQIVRHFGGYAAWNTGLGCGGIEVLTPNGESCGCLAPPHASAAVSVGKDGTLLVPYNDGASPSACTFDWYPALLK